MTKPTQQQNLTPEALFRALNDYQTSAAIKTAIDLELFTAIAEGHSSPAELAKQTQASERGLRILCDYLSTTEFIGKQGSAYALTPQSALFLDKRSPAYLGGIAKFLHSPTLREGFERLTEAVRRGGTALSATGTADVSHPAWIDFANSMGAMMFPSAEDVAAVIAADTAPASVLDIAASHGLFGILQAIRNPQAQVTALDNAAVLEVAARNARHFGVADRWKALPGDAFTTDLGTGYDLILVPNLFHHFSVADCERLMRRFHDALVPGGRCATLEFTPLEDPAVNPTANRFSLVMLATTAEGDAYTVDQYRGMFSNSGFSETTAQSLPRSPETLLISTKTSA